MPTLISCRVSAVLEDSYGKPLVFISFSSDDLPVVTPIHDLLARLFATAVNFFLAPRHVQLGVNWMLDIERELRRANCGLAFVSDAAAVSKWVLFEAGIAYGLGIPFIPLGILGFRIEKHDSPLAFLQGMNMNSAPELNEVIEKLAASLRVPRPRRVTEREFNKLFGHIVADAPPLKARSLLTRQAIYAELCDLIKKCGVNAEIRAMTTVHSDNFDKHFKRFLLTTSKQCGAALRNGGSIYYCAAFGLERQNGLISATVRRSIGKRFAAFKRAKALSAARFFEIERAGSLDVLMLNREHAIIAFPSPENVDHLQYGMHFSGYDLVNPLVNWFDNTVLIGAVALQPQEFQIE